MKNIYEILAVCFILFFFISSCGSQKELKIGYVDSDILMEKWDKYKKYGDDYIKEQEQWVKKLSENPKNISYQDQLEMQKSKEKWDKLKNEIVEEVRFSAKDVAEEKKYDIILDNGSRNPSIEFGGTDITSDVLKKLKK